MKLRSLKSVLKDRDHGWGPLLWVLYLGFFFVQPIVEHVSLKQWLLDGLGAAIFLAALVNPYRLMAAGWLLLLLGVAVFLFFSGHISGGQVFPAYIVAIGLALLGIALMGRRGYIKAGAVTPGLIVLLVGIIEVLLVANRTPSNFVPFMLSLWLPAIGLLVLGLIYLVASVIE